MTHDVIRAAREAVAREVYVVDQKTGVRQCQSCYEVFDADNRPHRDFCHIGKLAAAIAEFDRPAVTNDMASVVYRKGRLTEADYDEAIEALQLARAQAGDSLAGRGAVSCAICEDGDHTAESCHHNPLVLARRWAAARCFHACYHCGYIAYTDEEAKAHFGRHDDEVAKCLSDEAEGQIRAKLAKVAFDFYTRRVGELMHQAEHWFIEGYPLAVHHRVTAADECFQAIVAFDPARMARGHDEPFKAMEDVLARPPINTPGTYQPVVAVHHYRNLRFVVAQLDIQKKRGFDRG